jgi:protein SCO1/2
MSAPEPAASPSASLRAYRPAILAGALIAAGALVLVGTRLVGRGTTEPPRLGVLPDFHLMERSGRMVGRADLSGQPWVADFIFTQCGGACPAMTARMARLRRELPAGVRSVSFTVDPGHDTPPTLARYAAGFGADGDWLFVTGPQKDLYDLSTGGFKLAAMEVSPDQREAGGDGPFLHSSKFVLVDGQGVVRGYYDSTDEQALRALVSDARALKTAR